MAIKAQKVVTELRKIKDRYGRLVPEDVVKECSKKRHPLHGWSGWMDWDRDKLSREMLLQCARRLMSIRLTVQVGDKPAHVPISISVLETRSDQSQRTYIMYDDPDFADTLRAQAVNDGWGLAALVKRLDGHLTERERKAFDRLGTLLERPLVEAEEKDGED